MKTARVAAALLPIALLSVACGGGTEVKPSDGKSANVADQSPGTSQSADPKLPSEETLKAYFDGVADGSIESYQAAIDSAQPGSPAHAYAVFQQGLQQALIDGGVPEAGNTDGAEKTDKGFKWCESNGDGDESCYQVTEIQGEGGKVANFLMNGKSFDKRLVVGDGKRVAGTKFGASATFVGAYETTVGNQMYVVVTVKSGGTPLETFGAKYRSAQGRVAESGVVGPSELDANSLANYVTVIPNAQVGGTLTLTYYDHDYNTGTFTIKTR